MKRNEFEALLKIQDRYLLMCKVHRAKHDTEEHLHAADVVDRRHEVVMGGTPAKTPAAAVQRSIAKYFKQNANN
jgi:hypothetical protein